MNKQAIDELFKLFCDLCEDYVCEKYLASSTHTFEFVSNFTAMIMIIL